jgi:hypothetical protein
MLDDYWRLMPEYQQVALEDLTIRRILFGTFPTFRSSPLRPAFDRILQVGDASGIQSPLSFGGFGALTRHLPRLTRAIPEALQVCICASDNMLRFVTYHRGGACSREHGTLHITCIHACDLHFILLLCRLKLSRSTIWR